MLKQMQDNADLKLKNVKPLKSSAWQFVYIW